MPTMDERREAIRELEDRINIALGAIIADSSVRPSTLQAALIGVACKQAVTVGSTSLLSKHLHGMADIIDNA